MNQSFANLRRVLTALAVVALFSGRAPSLAFAQGDAKPAEPAPAPSTTQPAEKGKQAKQAKKAKAPKAPRVKAARLAAADTTAAKPKPASKPRAEKPAKPPEPSIEEQKKADGVYARTSNWLSFRFGYAKRVGDLTGDGLVGYGVGYQHMITRKYAFAAGVGHDVVGHFAGQIDEAVPFTAEFQRHFKWNSAVRPFVGLGGGYYLRKAYRTANDYNTTGAAGGHLSLGFTSALDDRHVIGLEARVARLAGRQGVVNPTFGPGEDSETLWTAKVSWALVY